LFRLGIPAGFFHFKRQPAIVRGRKGGAENHEDAIKGQEPFRYSWLSCGSFIFFLMVMKVFEIPLYSYPINKKIA
jgi:hypothetical protein